ncbi:ThuA domain-containing protein [Singulisphaera sp. PoT]|uniref:ThuA domain-containing protein n=1 Tax=Singulisphaera sp. PoT TaxID=3411797 RepID=UPI003BF53C33
MLSRSTSARPRLRRLRWFALLLAWMSSGFLAPDAHAEDADRPFEVRLRSRQPLQADANQYRVVEKSESWKPNETAIIVCDVWDLHHCLNAVLRVKEMAPTIERVLKTARKQGALIIHAPSDCMDNYKNHPGRKRAIETPKSSNLPADIGKWCYKIPSEEKGTYPIDQSDGGEDDDTQEHQQWAEQLSAMGRNPKSPWKSETNMLTIGDADYISDKGDEIWSVLEVRGIRNVILLGVHTNMCILGRPFGLRQLAKNGKNVVLMRDMTDTMYNPARAPFVSHYAGTDLIIEHIEKFVCPTITSDQILGGHPFRFKADPRPRAALVVAEDEYKTDETVPVFASAQLIKDYYLDYILASDRDRNSLPSINLLEKADTALISVRRRVLPTEQVEALKRFVASGKGIVGIRTASHAFSPRANEPVPEGHSSWDGFDAEVLGGNYRGHHDEGSNVKVTVAKDGAEHPILEGVDAGKLEGHGTLYKVNPLVATAKPLLIGAIPDHPEEPIAWTNAPPSGNRVFYTSLGHPGDFASPDFQKLLRNAFEWTTANHHSRTPASTGTE